MNNVTTIIVTLIINALLVTSRAWGQNFTETKKIDNYTRESEVAYMSRINMKLDSAIKLSILGKYHDADEKFGFLLSTMESIPSKMVYYFGKNSYHLKKYEQSLDWLKKYLELRGVTGQYSQETTEWISKVEKALLHRKKRLSPTANTNLHDIYCATFQEILCPACKGETVIVTEKYGENIYKPCEQCNQRGYVSCEQYIKIIQKSIRVPFR